MLFVRSLSEAEVIELKRMTRQEIGRVSQRVTELVMHDPQSAGSIATFWTLAMLVLALVSQLGVHLSPST